MNFSKRFLILFNSMSQFSYLLDFHIPWLKSYNTPLTFFSYLIKPGIYLHKQKWHGFFVSLDQQTFHFTLFTLKHAIFNLFPRNRSQEISLNVSILGDFLIEFLQKYTFHENDISVYNIDELGDFFFINHSTKRLLWSYEYDEDLIENRCVIKSSSLTIEMTVDNSRIIHVKMFEYDSHISMAEYHLKPKSLKSYLTNAGNIKNYESLYKIEFRISKSNCVLARKESSLWNSCQKYIISKEDSPKIFEILNLNN